MRSSLEREARLRAAVAAGGFGVWELDLLGGVLELDHHAKLLVGLGARVENGVEALAARAHPDDRERIRRAFERAVDASGPYELADELRCAGEGGGVRWLSIRGRSMFGRDGTRRVTGTLSDVTARRSVERERELLIEELARSVRMSELFVGIVGHDLRNPLAAIIAAARLAVGDGAGGGENRALHQRIVSSAERMRRLIDQLLDVTSARLGGGIPIQPAPGDAGVIAAHVVEEIRTAHPGVQCALETHGDARGTWDGDRLAQLLSNLVGNAVEHGGGDRSVTVVVDGRGAGAIELRVRNAGTIPPELRSTLFNPFRGSVRKRDGSNGLGLGLYISREIAIAHGGEIEVRARDGETEMVVQMPRVPGTPRQTSPGDPEVERLGRPAQATAITAEVFGVVSLHERAPDLYRELHNSWAELIEAALQREGEAAAASDGNERLPQIAEQLGALRAGPREVAELHAHALRQVTRGASVAHAAAAITAGRILAFELMGHLVSFYRRRAGFASLAGAP